MIVGFRPQKEWMTRDLMAIYLGGTGGAAYVISLLSNYASGIILGFILLCLGKSIFHLLSTGRPERFLFTFINLKTSWISKGLWVLALFWVLGGLVAGSYAGLFPGLRGTMVWPVIWIASLALSSFLIVYTGFMLSSCKGIPLWNNSMLTIVLPTLALISGTGLVLFASWFIPGIELRSLGMLEIASLSIGIFLTISYLWTARYIDVNAEKSVRVLLRESLAPVFWPAIVIGMILPLAIIGYLFLTKLAVAVFGVTGALQLLGVFLIKYSLFKAGVCRSLAHPWSYSVIID